MSTAFLTARWVNLCLCTYRVPPGLLEPRLPPGLTLDLRDGSAFVSLVAFDFQDTRVLGVSWPGYRRFAEVNLRFYVRNGAERGVVFVREFVPQRLVAWIAQALYNEPYRAAPLTGRLTETADQVTAEYRLTWQGKTNVLSVTGRKPPVTPPETSDEHFFKEHHWGFGVTRGGKALRYHVDHPVWETYPVVAHTLDFDWGEVYGPEWKFLDGAEPVSVVFAVGSPVAVSPKGSLADGERRL